MFQREHSSRAEVMYFVIAFFLFSLRLPSMHVALQPTWCWSIAFRLSPPLSSVLVATVSYRMQWSSPSPRGLHPFTTPHSSLSFPDICLKKKMQSLRFSSLFHRFFLICLLSQEKIPISLTPFLTRKIHNVSLCSFFFVRLLSLISTTDKARRQCHSIYTAFPVHHILIIVCQLLKTVFSLKDSHRNVIDSLTGNSAWTNRDNLMSNRSSTVYNQKHPCGLSLHAINIEKNSRGIYFPLFI